MGTRRESVNEWSSDWIINEGNLQNLQNNKTKFKDE